MSRKPITEIIQDIRKILEKEKELSIRQLSLKTGSQWRTVNKALKFMKTLNLVKERKDSKTKREQRLFSLK